MRGDDLADLNAFLAVAEESSFTRPAAKLGTSQSALSYAIRRLESRLDVRLLTRTTRRVAPIETGERLLRTPRPALGDIEAELLALGELRAKPSGTIRITTSRHAAEAVLWPACARLLRVYPETTEDNSLTGIVSERYDAEVRLGEQVAKDMVAVRIGPDIRLSVVGSPAYLAAKWPSRASSTPATTPSS